MANRTARDLHDRVLLQQRGLDQNEDRLGDWETVASSMPDGAWAAQIIRLRGGETVMAQRLQGSQPAIIAVRASSATRQVDNAWRVVDRLTRQIYDITSAAMTDDRVWVEILATGKAGDLFNG